MPTIIRRAHRATGRVAALAMNIPLKRVNVESVGTRDSQSLSAARVRVIDCHSTMAETLRVRTPRATISSPQTRQLTVTDAKGSPMTHRLPLLLSALVLVSCGGSTNGSPTSPTATQAAVTRIIAIEGSLAFGDVRVGQSKDLTVTIRNTGTGTLTLTGFSAPTALFNHLSAPAGSRTVAPGGTGTMTFRLTPLAVGPLAGSITINADHTSGNNTIAFSGTGIPAANE